MTALGSLAGWVRSRITVLRCVGLVYFVAAIVSFAETGGSHRFTWWNAFIFGIFCLSNGARGIRGIALLTSTVVLCGVIGMSAFKCSLFEEAIDDMGYPLYVAGTFAVHYLPWAVIVCTILFGTSSLDIRRRQLGPGAIIVCLRQFPHFIGGGLTHFCAQGASVFALYTKANDAGGE